MNAFEPLRSDPALDELLRRLTAGQTPLSAGGLWGSSAPILAALLAEQSGRPLLVVTAHADDADDYRDDIETATGTTPELLPQLEHLPHETPPDDELAAERMRLCLELQGTGIGNPGSERRGSAGADRTTDAGRRPIPDLRSPIPVVIAPIQALMQPVPAPEALRARSITVEVGQRLGPEALAGWLEAHGFWRCEQVESPGDYARRGGIVDVFSYAHADPVRVEFFGDEVESIRLFDAATQRSSHQLGCVQIPALQGAGRAARGAGENYSASDPAAQARDSSAGASDAVADPADTSFLNYLPANTLIAFVEPLEIQEIGRALYQRLGEPVGLYPIEAVFRQAQRFAELHVHRFAGDPQRTVPFDVGGLPQFESRSEEALRELVALAQDHDVTVFCDNPGEKQRLEELLGDEAAKGPGDQGTEGPSVPEDRTVPRARAPSLPRSPSVVVAPLHRGFRWGRRVFVPNHELFHRYRQRRTLRRVAPARPIDSFFDLSPGDPVVHILHGIGRFQGLKTIDRDGRPEEYLAIEFADRAVVHVATSQIHLVQKYIGSFRGKPTLSKLGGQAWKRTTQRVAEAVHDMAAELLMVQAQRATQPGLAYPADTTWQREFEESFLFTLTPDQQRALGEIKGDMSRPRPMDRLLCGDVGFGKTELALRAAFKAVEYGKQVAVLVPTTVLAEQHFETFKERLADYPFSVESLSRFRTRPEQARIVERARNGQVDILIGTHRLLSADVKFADLGLVIIDEEQRFGVEAKEKLKRLRATVDVLTLSATPIPRTLHMSMLGMRDISTLATPPVDRRAIVTQVRFWDDLLIRDAIVRELARGGQVYFVHNFVRDIEQVANRVRALAPEARVVVGHGQMPGPELEEVMLRFLHRAADVLVSTNIVESGLDVPTANTIFIDRAERFGLADLHQLRGRVGRSKHRAYCYLLLSPSVPLTDVAAKRLKAIEHYSDLGAGFQIAMRDLEIRGAGNILGAEQSGHIEAVGYEMYCQLLEQATRRLQNLPAETWKPVNLDLGISASIPRAYIRGERQRMEVYKRLTGCRTPADITALRDDLRDAYGPLPEQVELLAKLAELRVLAGPYGIRAIVLTPPDVVFSFDELARVRPLFETGPGSPRVPDGNTIHWRLPARLLAPPETLIEAIRRQLAGAADAPAPAKGAPTATR